MPKTRTAFWSAKFSRNVVRDRENRKALEALGWRVIEVWQCETKTPAYLEWLIPMLDDEVSR